MNCHSPVPSEQGKVIFEVFVCPTCHTLAERTYRRGEQEVRSTLTFLREIIREQLIKGQLQFPQQQPDEMDRTEVMRMIVRLQEAYDVARNSPQRVARIGGRNSPEDG